MDKALVIGLGMGTQYVSWLKTLGYSVTTVDMDPAKGADFTDHKEAVQSSKFNIIYIGTPNYTHELIARDVAASTDFLLIEKPGVKDSVAWTQLVRDFPSTRIAMVKNNQYRFETSGYKSLLKSSTNVKVVWSRQSGVPASPWFVDKERSFGGVSRDLMPHLLSYYTNLTNYQTGIRLFAQSADRTNTGIDDHCEIEFTNNRVVWLLEACWRNNSKEEHYIEFTVQDKQIRFELGDYFTAFGGCPAGPYMNMIKTCMDNLNNQSFWDDQLEQDVWIHKQIENL